MSMRYFISRNLLLLLFCSIFFCAENRAQANPVVETEPDLQLVLGDLTTLAVAVRHHTESMPKSGLPALEQLERYFENKSLTQDWPKAYQLAEHDGDWWVGRNVTEFSRSRKFMRTYAKALGLFETPGGSPWFSGGKVWIKIRSAATKTLPSTWAKLTVVPGQADNAQHLFINIEGTDYYWWSNLLFTPSAREAILKMYRSTHQKEGLRIPNPSTAQSESIKASPVGLPEEFTVSKDEEIQQIEMGGVIFNPIPKMQN